MLDIHCTTCNQTKTPDCFSRGKIWKNNTLGKCKPCVVKATQAQQRTVPGLIKKIFHNQKMTTTKMGRPLPQYTETELLQWALQQGLEKLYQSWKTSGYDKWVSPSIDRKDNTQSYTLDNIRLITWRENLDNQKSMNVSGEYLHTGSKAVDQLTLEGEYLQTYPSIACAMRDVAGHRKGVSNITSVCENKWPTAYGFKWRWAEALS